METKQDLYEKIKGLEDANRRLQQTIDEHKHLVNAVDAKDKEMGTLSQQLSTKWQKQIDEKEAIIKVLVGHIQTYQQAYRSFLKLVQGGLENAVEYEALLSDKLNHK